MSSCPDCGDLYRGDLDPMMTPIKPQKYSASANGDKTVKILKKPVQFTSFELIFKLPREIHFLEMLICTSDQICPKGISQELKSPEKSN
jgi:hypothetical protein